jgi:DNA uptake protein ComE-like DNA-binding protein
MHVRIFRVIRLLTLAVFLAGIIPAWPMPQTDQSSSSADAKTKRSKTKKASADQNTPENATAKLDLNTATKEELDALSGVGEAYAQRIIEGRPYKSKIDLVRKGVLPQSTYDKIKDQVTARRTSKTENSGEVSATPPASTGKPSSSEPEEKASKKERSRSSSNEKYSNHENEQETTSITAQTPPEKGMVWVNLDSGIYHREGDRWYGKTKQGKFMSEADAQRAGYRVSKVRQSEK